MSSRSAPEDRARRTRVVWLALTASFVLVAGCGADSADLANPSFDKWCKEGPCDWQLDEGQVSQVSTWHREDFAVEFAYGNDAQISQLQGPTEAQCLHFDMVARVDAEARLWLLLDFNDDGQPDWRQPITGADWRNVPFTIPTPTLYKDVRFILRKIGKGSAVVAQIVVSDGGECPDGPLGLANGSSCALDAMCASGACVEQRCVEEKPAGSE